MVIGALKVTKVSLFTIMFGVDAGIICSRFCISDGMSCAGWSFFTKMVLACALGFGVPFLPVGSGLNPNSLGF